MFPWRASSANCWNLTPWISAATARCRWNSATTPLGDKLCCPTLQTQRRFALENGKLLCRFSNSLPLQPEAVHVDAASPFGAVTSRIETGRLRLAKVEEPGDRYPEHVRLWLGGQGSSGAVILAEPQLRVIPVEGYEAILEGADAESLPRAGENAEERAGEVRPPARAPCRFSRC